MGADLNLRFEYKGRDGKWLPLCLYTKEGRSYIPAWPDVGRDCNMWEALDPFICNRLPDDCSKQISSDHRSFGCGAYHEGWASYATLYYMSKEAPHDVITDDEGKEIKVKSPYTEFLEYLDMYISLSGLYFTPEEKIVSTRMVFWFDN